MGKRYHRFLQKNRNKGIPNLMLYICIANAVLLLYTKFTGDYKPMLALRFDIEGILRGQIWRCATWLISYAAESNYSLLSVVFYILFNHWLGNVMESVWGTFRLNIYYLGGALITTVAAVLIGLWGIPVHVSAYYLNISLMLAVATLLPEERIFLFGIFSLKMRWLALFDVILILVDLIRIIAPYHGTAFMMVLLIVGTAPLISLLNYVLNFGKDVGRLFHTNYSYKQIKRHHQFKKAVRQPRPNLADQFRNKEQGPFRHKCTVCGRTDATDPNLEFRYCSRCNGYYCYCTDHINNHTHIE